MEINIETNDFDEYYKSLCEKVLFPLLNKLADNIKSLKYFVIGSSDTNVFVKTIAKYSSKLHTDCSNSTSLLLTCNSDGLDSFEALIYILMVNLKMLCSMIIVMVYIQIKIL